MWRALSLFIAVIAVATVAALFFGWRSIDLRESESLPHFDHSVPAVPLTPAEQERLLSLPALRMGYMPNWYPLSFDSDKTESLSGVAGDYAALLSKLLGLRVTLVPI